jgi:hypothetical protein
MMTDIRLLWGRTLEIRKAIAGFSIASVIDIAAISSISVLYEQISKAQGKDLMAFALIVVILVILRTVAVFSLRRYSFGELMAKKSRDEYELVKAFIQRRSRTLPEKENNLIAHFKESIINSTQLATVNFDLPMASLIGELLFAVGGVLVLVYNVGIALMLAMTPIALILLLIMKAVANRLRSLGEDVMLITENRLVRIDNIAEASLELCVASGGKVAADYFDAPNHQLNSLVNRQLSLSNSVQLVVESASFVIILLCLILIALKATALTMGGAAASLAVLARMVPTITRSISSVTQLHYGIPAVIKLHINKRAP